ncbi:MAG: phosphate acetyltransferase [Fibrobacter sp.]|nr:phosphate acetyltransferase [Fibrobacter sp.]
MRKVYIIAPTGTHVDTAKIAESFFNFVSKQEPKTVYFKPIGSDSGSISQERVQTLLSSGNASVLMEQLVTLFMDVALDQKVVVVEGISANEFPFRSKKLNEIIAQALNASVILVSSALQKTPMVVKSEVEIEAQDYFELKVQVASCVITGVEEITKEPLRLAFKTSFVPVLAYATSDKIELDAILMKQIREIKTEHHITQPEFRANLMRQAGTELMRIVLPEGNEVRTIKAAIMVYERKIALPVLLGDRIEIEGIAKLQGLDLPPGLEVIALTDELRERFVEPLVEIRKHKGMTVEMAKELLQSPIWVGTMMLKMAEVDGLVSGAVHSTADTVRPALQVIKTQPGVKSISSSFFICLPTQILVYGDCAINQKPNSSELASIAIQCHDTAKSFNLPTKVAMLTYSTGTSGHGEDVDLVVEATSLVRSVRPDIVIDGPLQYDSATDESVAKIKAPHSAVAGKASVIVFPNLSAGNITYKAVQRSAANVICIGPMLQGLARPVNDLSRGAFVDDIIYTIALTAIQAQSIKEKTCPY